MRPVCGRRLWSGMVTLAGLVALVVLFGAAATAEAGVITTWRSIQPKGTVGTNIPVIISGSGRPDGSPLVSATAKLYLDGLAVPRSAFTASIGSASVYFYYNPQPVLTDGPHTFRVEVSDSRGALSSYQWGATVAQPPTASWVTPTAGATLNNGRPTILMALSDNTPGTTFGVAGQVHSGSAAGPVVATFGGTAVSIPAFSLPNELPPGTYYLTAAITDAAGNTKALQGSAARQFATAAAPAMTVLESCDSCHPGYVSAHPTPSATDCAVCHPGYDGDHMEGTEYCEDCHYDGWHEDGDGAIVAVTSPCASCHTSNRPEVPRHDATNTAAEHASSCDGCHSESLLIRHAFAPAGSSYPNQCDVCHDAEDARVITAIAEGDAACSACHDAEPGHGFDLVMHQATIDSLGMFGTWPYLDTTVSVNGTLMNVPYVYEDVVCLGCHTATIGGPDGEHSKQTASSASDGCAACHPTPVSDGGMTRPWDKTCYACHPQPSVHTPADLATVHSLQDGDPSDEGSCGFTNPLNGRRPCHYSDIVQEHNRLISDRIDIANAERSVTCDECHTSAASIAALADGWDGTCTDCHDGASLPNHTVAGTVRADSVYALHNNPGGYYDNGDTVSGSNAMDAHGPVRVNPNTVSANKTIGCGAPTCHTSSYLGGGWPFGTGPACAECHGPNQAPLPPFQGAYAWASGSVDDGQSLQTELMITLPALPAGSALDFKTLYDIEEGYDYGYVQVSVDGGSTWTNLAGNITTTTDPYGMNQGNGITGASDGWVDAHFDLSAYAGQAVQLRFAYITDTYVFGTGWKLDLITVGLAGAPVFSDDAETAKAEMLVQSTLGYWEWDDTEEVDVWVTVPTTAGWSRYTNP